jgi:hypothetical protein
MVPDERVSECKARQHTIAHLLLQTLNMFRVVRAVHGPHCKSLLHYPYYHTSGTPAHMLMLYSWMVGPNWPNQGEIDIYEGVHLSTSNQITLHTSPGCTPTVGAGGETGRRLPGGDCGAGGGFNGCGIASTSPTSYGTAFNANGGGVCNPDVRSACETYTDFVHHHIDICHSMDRLYHQGLVFRDP